MRQRTINFYNKTCETSEDSDQTALSRSLIRVFADHMCLLQPPGYPRKDKRESFPYGVAVHADLSLCWSNRYYCGYCRALAQIILIRKQQTLLYLLSIFMISNGMCNTVHASQPMAECKFIHTKTCHKSLLCLEVVYLFHLSRCFI